MRAHQLRSLAFAMFLLVASVAHAFEGSSSDAAIRESGDANAWVARQGQCEDSAAVNQSSKECYFDGSGGAGDAAAAQLIVQGSAGTRARRGGTVIVQACAWATDGTKDQRCGEEKKEHVTGDFAIVITDLSVWMKHPGWRKGVIVLGPQDLSATATHYTTSR